MSFQYKIGEISALLGISPETLRFYEKRGLLQPEKSPHNGYRSYSQNDLYRLLDIIFYRRLDLGLDDIRHLLTTDDLTAITQLLAEQQEALEQKIALETLTLKKLETVRRSWQQIPKLLGRFVCQALPPAYILLENQPAGDTLQRFSILSQEHLELSQFLEPLVLCADHWQRTGSMADDHGLRFSSRAWSGVCYARLDKALLSPLLANHRQLSQRSRYAGRSRQLALCPCAGTARAAQRAALLRLSLLLY